MFSKEWWKELWNSYEGKNILIDAGKYPKTPIPEVFIKAFKEE